MASAAAAAEGTRYGDYIVYFDESSKLPYFYNTKTQQTQWDKPEEIPLSAVLPRTTATPSAPSAPVAATTTPATIHQRQQTTDSTIHQRQQTTDSTISSTSVQKNPLFQSSLAAAVASSSQRSIAPAVNTKAVRSDTRTQRLRRSVIRTGDMNEHVHTPSMSEVPPGAEGLQPFDDYDANANNTNTNELDGDLYDVPRASHGGGGGGGKLSFGGKKRRSVSSKRKLTSGTGGGDDEAVPQWNADVAEIPRRYVWLTRVLVCVIAIGLLWCTTLTMSKGIAQTFLQSPGSRVVITNWETVLAVGEYEMQQHRYCADLQVTRCDRLLNASLTQLVKRDKTDRATNLARVRSADDVANTCNANMLQVYDITDKWIQDDTLTHTFTYRANCSSDEQKELDSYFSSAGSASKSTAFFLAQKYADNTKMTMKNLDTQVDARVEYDRDYLDNKTGKIRTNLDITDSIPTLDTPKIVAVVNVTIPLDRLVGCISGTSNGNCPQQSIVAAYKDTEQAFNESYNQVYAASVENYQKTQDFRDVMVQKMSAIQSVFNKMQSVSQVTIDGLSAVGVSVGNLPSTSVPSINLTPIPAYMVIETITKVFDRLTPGHVSTFDADFEAIRSSVNTKMLELQAKVNISTNIALFEDYNPPNISVNRAQQDKDADEFVDQQASVLGQVDESKSNVDTNGTETSVRTFIATTFRHNITFDPLAFGGALGLQPLIQSFDNLIWFILLIDILYRVWKTLHLIHKYTRYSGVGLPVVDVRSHSKSDEKSAVSCRGRMMAFLFSPYFMVPAVVLLIALALASVVKAYVPIYQNYQEGCVRQKTGTVLTNNTYAFVMNVAKLKGDQKIDDAMSRYDASRTQSCIELGDKSTTELNTRVSQLANARTTHTLARRRLELFEKCVDPSTFNKTGAKDVAQGTFWARNPSYKRPNTLVSNTWDVCHSTVPKNTTLIDAVFNCSQIPDCTVLCNGPNEYIIRQSTFEAGCRSESLVHAVVWQTIVALVIYVCLNVSRVLVVASMSRLFWRALTPYGFVFLASCSRKGETDQPKLKRLREKLHSELTSFERSAVILLFAALIVHLPYIILFQVISNPLKDSQGFNYHY